MWLTMARIEIDYNIVKLRKTLFVFCVDDFSCFYSEVVDKGGVDPLITLLNDVKPLVQANAAVCLTNLATEGKFLIFFLCAYLQQISFLTTTVFDRLPKAILRVCSTFAFLRKPKAIVAWHQLVFFPALRASCMFSRAWRRLRVFPRLSPATCFRFAFRLVDRAISLSSDWSDVTDLVMSSFCDVAFQSLGDQKYSKEALFPLLYKLYNPSKNVILNKWIINIKPFRSWKNHFM